MIVDNIATLFIPKEDFFDVQNAIKKSGVKFYPFIKRYKGYEIKLEPSDHPLVSFLILKYDINIQ